MQNAGYLFQAFTAGNQAKKDCPLNTTAIP
uniref:Uncharacterized protein n=1 Tax=Anguilla anguilla TaxID=7936 RepID=A0A0E9V3Z3_ANGAN